MAVRERRAKTHRKWSELGGGRKWGTGKEVAGWERGREMGRR